MDELQNIMLSEINEKQRLHVVYFHLGEMWRTGDPWRQKSVSVIQQQVGGENGK